MNKRGFTLIEVIVSFVLVTAVSLSLFKAVVALQQSQKANIALNSFKAFSLAINNEIQYDFLTDIILSTNSCGTNCYDIEFKNKGVVRITLDREDGVITYGDFKEKLPKEYIFYDDMTITSYASSTTGLNSYVALTIPVKSSYEPNLNNIKYMYQYDSTNPDIVNELAPLNATDLLVSKIGTGGLIKDDHNELRYQGSDPDNYVTFNGEEAGWRIVGLFDVNGKQRVKLVRKDSIGSFSWDTSAAEVNGGNGINEWSQADLNTLLNNYYYNGAENEICYNGASNASITCSFDGLTDDAKKLIGSATWNLGASEDSNSLSVGYSAERGLETCQPIAEGVVGCETNGIYDGVQRTVKWQGLLGLIYPSDYGYASDNAACKNALNGTCDNNWMSSYGWTITPDVMMGVTGMYAGKSRVIFSSVRQSRNVHPVVYLIPNVKLKGSGTIADPYVFILN